MKLRLPHLIIIVVLGLMWSCSSATSPVTYWNGDDGKVIPSGYEVVGYFASWSSTNPASLMFHRLTRVNWAFAAINADGTLGTVPNTSGLSTLVTNAQGYGVKVFLSVGGWLSDSPNPAAFRAAGATPSTAQTFANQVLGALNTYHLDGVDIDWEYPNSTSAAAYERLLTTLGAVLHRAGKQLSIAAGTGTSNDSYITSAALASVDYLDVMAYDDPVPQSTLALAQSATAYWTARVTKSKVIVGVPFYGRAWSNWNTTATFAQITAGNSAAAQEDNDGTWSYNGIPTIQAKAQAALSNAGGTMIWELSQDAPGSNSLLSAIYNAVSVAKP